MLTSNLGFRNNELANADKIEIIKINYGEDWYDIRAFLTDKNGQDINQITITRYRQANMVYSNNGFLSSDQVQTIIANAHANYEEDYFDYSEDDCCKEGSHIIKFFVDDRIFEIDDKFKIPTMLMQLGYMIIG